MAGSLALTSKSRLRRPRVAKIRETKGRGSGGRPQLAGRVLAGLGAVLAQVEVEDLGRFAVGAQPAVVEPAAARTDRCFPSRSARSRSRCPARGWGQGARGSRRCPGWA